MAQESIESTLFAVLCLNVQMIVVLPVVKVLYHVFGVAQRLEDLSLSNLGVPVPRSLKGLLALLHSINPALRRTVQMVGGGRNKFVK
jgi:hypothetical protein